MINISKTSFGSGDSRKVTINTNIPASSRQRRRELGKELEGPNNVTWVGDWEPNKQYVKTIHLKNTSLNLLKVKFTSPTTRTFSTPYSSQVIKLAAGSTKELAITFRPTEFVQYQDSICLNTTEGTYQIQLEAKIQTPRFTFPKNITFEPCSVKETARQKFTAHNRTSLETKYKWICYPSEFSISPCEGVLGPEESQQFGIEFHAKNTSLFKGIAQCRFGSEFQYSKKITLTASASFPQIFIGNQNKMTKSTVLNLGNVEKGQSLEKKVRLYNPSNVTSRVTVEVVDYDDSIIPSDIDCPMKSLEIPSMGSLLLPIVYTPMLASETQIKKTIKVSCSNCPQISFVTIDCVAKSPPAAITISNSTVDFRTVEVNNIHHHNVRLDNKSSIKATFQFLCNGPTSVWNFSPNQGILNPGEYATISISFSPNVPAPYYRKVPLLIDGAKPMFIELSGSAYNQQIQPCHISPEQFRTKVSPDVEKLDFDTRQKLFNEEKLKLTNDYLHFADESSDPESITANWINGFSSLFEEDSNTIPAVSLSTNSVSFGQCIPDGTINAMPIQVTNHTEGEIIAQWYQAKESKHFSVNPPSQTLAPGASYIFTARFQIFGHAESVYGGELELNCFYKQMIDYSEVKSSFIHHGWCRTVNVSAHTFKPSSEPFPSKVVMPKTIISPPTLSSWPTYTTVLMQSDGELPVTFDFSGDDYKVFPSVGMVSSDSGFQLVVLRSVSHDDPNSGELKVQLNADPKYNQTMKVLTLHGKPKLKCNPEVYLQPTLVGGKTVQEVSIQNQSRLPVNFKWAIPSKSLQIKPAVGLIEPMSTMTFDFSFKPTCQKQYLIKPELQCWAHSSQTDKKIFRCISEGVGGRICAASSFLDFGSLMVNKTLIRKLNILNQSNCTVDVDLSTIQMVNGEIQSENYLQIENDNSSFDFLRLEPRSSKILYLSVNCPKDGNYSWEIFYSIKSEKGTEKALLTHATAEVCYPLLRMTHLSCSDLIPKQLLYRWSNIAKIDALLRTTPNMAELNQGQLENSADDTEFIDVNFGCSTVSSSPFVLRFEIANPGNTEASFKFLFPADLRLELEGWADNAELTQSQYHMLQVEDNKLFQVKPRSAKLGPDERCVVKIIYSHHLVGIHSLPVLLSIDGGRQLPMRFSGVTLSSTDQYLHFPSPTHHLKPVELGLLQSPVQEVDIYNGSNSRIHYSIDMISVQRYQVENWNWRVFDILTPKGVIGPNSTGKIYVSFSPLETQEYEINLTVNIMNGESQEIELRGKGFDPRNPPKEAISDMDEFLTDGSKIAQTNLLCALSVDRIKLGDVPLNSPVRRILFLENHSVSTAAHFSWSGLNNLVEVEPQFGTLEPEQKKLVMVKFLAESDSGPAFHNIELSCHVTSNSDQMDYEVQLEAWEAEKKRQEDEFVITDSKFQLSQAKLIDPLTVTRDSTPVSPYRTLPPISPSIYGDRNRGTRFHGRKPRKEQIWFKPMPPKPDLLPLTITSRTLDRTQYLGKYPQNLEKQFISVNKKKDSNNREPEGRHSIYANEDETTILRVLMGNVIRTLLEDIDMQKSLLQQSEEKPIYFAELKNANWPPKIETDGANNLMNSIMRIDEVNMTPFNSNQSLKSTSSNNDQNGDNTVEEKKCVESIMSQLVKNILSSASSGDTILTAKPRKIVEKPAK